MQLEMLISVLALFSLGVVASKHKEEQHCSLNNIVSKTVISHEVQLPVRTNAAATVCSIPEQCFDLQTTVLTLVTTIKIREGETSVASVEHTEADDDARLDIEVRYKIGRPCAPHGPKCA